MSISVGGWYAFAHLYVGYGGDRCRFLAIRLGRYRLTLSNWFSDSLGRWSVMWENCDG